MVAPREVSADRQHQANAEVGWHNMQVDQFAM